MRNFTELSIKHQQMQDLLFAWKVAKLAKSDAIVFCASGMTMGVDTGPMS